MTAVRKALKEFVANTVRWPNITGTVQAVDGDSCDVTPADGGPTLYSVRLKPAATSGTLGIIVYPKVGSNVVLLRLNGDDNAYAVAQVETIDHVHVQLDGGTTMELKADGTVEVNGTQYGGLVKVQDLRQDLTKVNTFLTTLRSAINSAPGGGDVAPFKAALSSALASLEIPTYQTIESQSVKHGSA